MARRWCPLLGVALLATTAQVQAQDDGFSLDEPDSTAAESELPPPAEEEGPMLLGDEQAIQEESAPTERYRESTNPYEDPKQSYFFVGAAWRYTRMPSWVLEWFMESAPAVGAAGSFFGEFGYRKDGFQVTADVGYMNWDFSGPFQLSGDPTQDTEWLDAKWSLLMTTATITWSTNFTDWMALEYGFEVGAAFIFGDMTRTEAVLSGGRWSPCAGWAGSPALPAPSPDQSFYCDQPIPETDTDGNGVINDRDTPPADTNSAGEIGAHYGVKANKGIANKGVPRAVPVLGPRLSLRFKPIHQLVIRVDVPLPVLPLGFMGGVAVHYGF